MKITITGFNPNDVVNKYELQTNGNSQLWFANNCFRRMQKYVPFDTGALSTTVTIRPHSVTYEVPYAHKQYTTNKGSGLRGKYWDKKMFSAEKDVLIRETKAYIEKQKGNK